MAFIYKQVNLLEKKELRNSLQMLYGFGWYKSILACSRIGLCYPFFICNLNVYNFNFLSCFLDSISWIEAKVLRFINLCMEKHIEIRSYKGIRYLNKLPVRGQRTRSNAKSCKRQNLLKI